MGRLTAGRRTAYLLGILGVCALVLVAALLWLPPADSAQAQDDGAQAEITAGPAITSSPESGGTYGKGEKIVVAVTFSEPVTVTGEPRLGLNIGEKRRWAKYDRSDEDGARLIFSYQVKAADTDDNGVSIKKNAIDLNGGAIEDDDGNRARLRHGKVSDQAGHKVDATPPAITSVDIISVLQQGASYEAGDAIETAVTFSEPVRVGGVPRLRLTIGSKKRWAEYDYSDQAGARLVFTYVVKSKDWDDDGVSIGKNKLYLNDGSMQDAAGNAANLAHGRLPSDPAHRVDGDGDGDPQGNVAAPGKLTDLWATGGNQRVALTWYHPDSEYTNPTITKYQVKAGSGSWTDIPGSDPLLSGHTVTGLTNATEYSFQVRAVNAGGNGVASDVIKATPRARTPAKPAGLSVTPAVGTMWLSWTDPADDTMPIYELRVSGGGHAGDWEELWSDQIVKRADGKLWYDHPWGPWLSDDDAIYDSSGDAYQDHAPVPGVQYTYRIRAMNDNGPGMRSDAVTGTPLTGSQSPAKPSGVTAAAGNGQVVLSWTNPNDSKIEGYLYRMGSGAGTSFGPITHMTGSGSTTVTHTFTGLTNGTAYRFVITSYRGQSYASEFSDVVSATQAAE